MSTSNYAHETQKVGSFTVRVVTDPEPSNPREDYSNIAMLCCWHDRYSLGDTRSEVRNGRRAARPLYRDSEGLLADLTGADLEDEYHHDEQFLCALEGDAKHPADAGTKTRWRQLKRKRRAYHHQTTMSRLLKRALEEKALAIVPLFLYDHSGITIYTGSPRSPRGWDSSAVGWAVVTREALLEAFPDMQNMPEKALRKKAEEIVEGEVKTYDRYLTGEVYGFEVLDEEGDVVDSCWGFYDDTAYVLKEGVSSAQYLQAEKDKKDAQRAAYEVEAARAVTAFGNWYQQHKVAA